MNKTSMPGGIGSRLASVDPGHSVTESDLVRSRARSLVIMESPAEAPLGSVSRIDAGTRSHTSSRTRPTHVRRRVILASTAAAFLAGTLVVVDVIPGNQGGATAEAAEIFTDAASATITTSDPVVGPGQYLKIDTTAVSTASVLLGEGPVESRRTVEWLDQSSDQLYIPADQSAEWIWNREARIPTTFFSEDDKAEAIKYQQPQTGVPGQAAEVLRGPGGSFYGTERLLFADLPVEEGIRTLPRDPQALLDVIRQRVKAGREEAETLEAIASALGTGAVPADLRAALYKAAALIPGVTVVDTQANLDGQTGTALGIEHASRGTRIDIIIDPTTGLLIGEREVTLTDGETFPAGTAVEWTAVNTSVVNDAP